MEIQYIYALICPESRQVKYVGKTQNIKRRVRQHILKSKKFLHLEGKNKWIRDLDLKDLKPIVKILEACSEDLNWNEREKYWIKYYSDINPLFNQTEGGEDYIFEKGNTPWNKGGGKYSEGSREKMRLGKLGRILPEQHKERIKQSMQGKRPTDECIKKSAELRYKKILEYSGEGNFIKEWGSVTEVAAEYKTATTYISKCCKTNLKCRSKRFRYYQENYSLNILIN